MNSIPLRSVCILGRQPALGLAELESLYGVDSVTLSNPQAAGLTLHASEVNFARLGGSTRLAHILSILPTTNWREIEQALPELITELSLTVPEGKIQLGLSSFDLAVSAAKLNAAGLTLKKTLRKRTDRSVRVTPNPETELNTAQVLHNHLTGSTGIELLLIATSDKKTIIARTTHVQDINSYTLRDRGRPKRDARVGMLPPKLAQIIINLASGETEPSSQVAVLDPFCGTGVLLQEAMLMGYGVLGSDIDKRMVEYTKINLAWIQDQVADASHDIVAPVVEEADATTHTWQHMPALVACETYLGRPFTDRPAQELLAQTISEVNLILKKFLHNMHGQIPKDGRMCLAVPAWQFRNGEFKHLPLIDQLADLGYNRVSFEHIRDEQLLYYREDQIVARELLVLTRK